MVSMIRLLHNKTETLHVITTRNGLSMGIEAFHWKKNISGIELDDPRICIIICNHTRYTGHPRFQKNKSF